MSGPLAYLLTWTCYGTWLHGDKRGSVDNEHNTFGSPWIAPNLSYRRYDEAHLRHPAIKLDGAQRKVVSETITDHCRYRDWDLYAVNARSNHVHAVVAAGEVPAERVLSELKAWSTRRLREKGLLRTSQRLWTRHGSTRYVWNESSIAYAVDYVHDRQDHDEP